MYMSTENNTFIANNLKLLRGSMSQQEFAAKLGLKSYQNYQRYEAGKVPNIRTLQRIAGILDIPIDVLVNKEITDVKINKTDSPPSPNGGPIISIPKLRRGEKIVIGGITWQAVPVISWASAGAARSFTDMEGQIDELIVVPTKDSNSFALIIEGDSMEPNYPAGGIVTVEPNQYPRKNKLVVARLREFDGVLFKHCDATGDDGRNVVLRSYNPVYPIVEKPRKEFEYIYPVISVTSITR